MLQDLTNDKIEFLKSQHKETLQSLSTQHKKAIEDLTKMFEERLSASELRFHKLEEDFRAVLDKKSKEFEEKNIDFEIERTKIHQNLKEYYRRKIEEELTLREKEEKLREKQLEERFEKQIANFFEKIRKEYEDQLSSYEIRLNQCENEKMEIEKMKNQLEEKLKHFIEKNFSNNYVQTEIIEIVQNKNNKIKMKNSEQNTEESNKITPEEKKLSTTELEETIIKIISSEERKNQENLIKNEKNEELQRIEKNKEFTHIIKNKISYEYDKDSNVFQEQEKNQLFVWDRELGTLINRLQDIIERKNQTLLEKNSQIDSLNALLQTYNDNYLSLISLKSC